jgi:hypothetical protein
VRTWRKPRRTVSRKSSFFVPKRRKRYGWEMPARRAMSSVDVPAKPFSANCAIAASRISSRRTSALFRSVVCVATGRKLSLTYNAVKRSSPA